MTFFLLMLLAGIALIITLVGYLLTARPQARNSRAAYQTDSYVNRPRRRVRRPVELETPRYIAYVEQRSGSTDIWQALVPSRILRKYVGNSTPWMGITLVLVSIFLLGVFLLRAIMPNAMLIAAVTWPYTSSSTSSSQPTPAPSGPYTASRNLVRLSQLDPAQYNSNQEYNTWAYSACSAASMTEVINAYGHHYRVTDILKVESAIGEITPQMGLLEDVGIERTATHFGFKTTWGHKLALNDVIDIANHGRPVIVSFPPDRYAGGHLLVVTGGDSQNVYLADSSRWNRQSLTHAQFLNWWEGFTAILTPN
ncbi:MAG: C39 family peptidase [Ktedonobacteraceae bacterium]